MTTRSTYSLGLIPVIMLLAVVLRSSGGDDRQATQRAAATDTISTGDIALGRKVYDGKAGGALCATCHGPQAKGVPGLGPDLTDNTWLHGDGSVVFLRTVIRSGVMKPKKSTAVMPPNGGGNLNAAQLDAVAAYVGSLQN
jgi:mono/diheme cytochrome c family protein